MQEGWHYELDSVDDELTYKGVVFNEVEGFTPLRFSTRTRIDASPCSLDTTYGVDSGGNPDNITDLTYENSRNSTMCTITPSNSYIFLYGTMNIEEQLRFINDEYLSHFDAIEIDTEVTRQAPFKKGKSDYISL